MCFLSLVTVKSEIFSAAAMIPATNGSVRFCVQPFRGGMLFVVDDFLSQHLAISLSANGKSRNER